MDLTIREIGPGTHEIGGFDLEAIETRHSMYCFGYRIDDSVAISGDTAAFEDLVEFAAPADVLVHDCSFPDGVEVSNHPTPASLGEVLSGQEFETVYLTHLYPHTDGKHEEMLASMATRYDGDVQFARDGLTVEL
jgi:ribonuclease BN (tRNA processing enzyme)